MDREKLQKAGRKKSKIKVTIEHNPEGFDESDFDYEVTYPGEYLLLLLGDSPKDGDLTVITMDDDGDPLDLDEAFSAWAFNLSAVFLNHPSIHKQIRKAIKMFREHLEGLIEIIGPPEGPKRLYPEDVTRFSNN